MSIVIILWLLFYIFLVDTGAFNISINSEFSPGVDPIFLEYVGCNGDEADLLSCTREQPLGLARCPHSDDVGLVCPGEKSRDKNTLCGTNRRYTKRMQ